MIRRVGVVRGIGVGVGVGIGVVEEGGRFCMILFCRDESRKKICKISEMQKVYILSKRMKPVCYHIPCYNAIAQHSRYMTVRNLKKI
jgi:hypothetical protein